MKKFRCWLALSLPLILASTCGAQDDLTILLRRVPETADALLIVRLQALLDSPRGQQENWSEKYQLGYLNGAVRIPPVVKSMLMATDIQTNESAMATVYGVALLKSKKRLSMELLAANEGGEVVTVANRPVVLTSRNSFIVELAPGFVGAVTPPNRKELARWMRFAMTDHDPVISSYLRDAVVAARGAQIQMAVDLRDIVDPKAVRLWLKSSKVMEGYPSSYGPLYELIKGLRGLRFSARVNDKTTGEVSLDFSNSVEDRANAVKELFLESLNEMGAAIDEFRDSKVRTEADGKTVVLKAELTDATLREILSLIQMPSIPATPEDDQPSPTYSPGGKVKVDLATTERYYNAVQQLLEDLRKKLKKADDYNKTALWHETYAKKIAQLPRQGADEEMLQYGATVSSQLLALANSLRGVPLKVDLLQGEKYYYTPPTVYLSFGRRPAPFIPAPTYTDTNIPEITAQQREAVSQGESDRQQIWKTLDEAKYRVRQRMSEKFKTDFGLPKN